ncbi:MAG: tetratricopeptide repeat protein [Acidobacteriaceae bacterium]|nr:tetratricopeptide repeat protein [Acidobacteriaceae bacterium]
MCTNSLLARTALSLFACGFAAGGAPAATVLVLQFHNSSPFTDLNWVGESIADTLRNELSAQNQIVFDRDSRAEAMRRLSLRPDAGFTKATLIRLGQTLDADYLCYGSYEASLAAGETQLKQSSLRVTAHFLDLRKMHDGPDVSETGQLSELSRLEEHLAWESLKYVDPAATLSVDFFLAPQKLIRMDAEESYIRGLMSTNPDQQQKWFAQAAALDPHFSSPAYELGRLALQRKEYRQALTWFQRIAHENPRYPEARFQMGLAAFEAGEYSTAAGYFREALKIYPLSEVYNDLGAAENELGLPAAIDEYRHALEGEPDDTIYLFNLGAALLKNGYFDEAVKRLQAAVDRAPEDAAAQSLLERARNRDAGPAGTKVAAPPRLKQSFDETAFRQLKAMVQPKQPE